jgi:hypothetical protein
MVDIEHWVRKQVENGPFERVEIGDETHLVVYRETDDHLELRERVPEGKFYEMFGPVFERAETESDLTPERLKEVSRPDPESESELHRADWGYERIIDYWVDENVI